MNPSKSSLSSSDPSSPLASPSTPASASMNGFARLIFLRRLGVSVSAYSCSKSPYSNSRCGRRGGHTERSGTSSSEESTRRRNAGKCAFRPLGPARCDDGGGGIREGGETGRSRLSRAIIRSMTSLIRIAAPGRASASRLAAKSWSPWSSPSK